MSASEQVPQGIKLQYIDRPEVLETFADTIENVHFDGGTLRLELGVTRMDPVKPNEALTARRYPVSRLVLSVPAALDLINKMQQVGAALTQAGLIKPTPAKNPTAAN
jgi:hypothetical protein